MRSETIVVEAPLSFAGSFKRLRNLLWKDKGLATKTLLGWWMLPVAIGLAWAFVACWYVVFGLLLAPYRLVRRGNRKRKREQARHQELVEAVAAGTAEQQQ